MSKIEELKALLEEKECSCIDSNNESPDYSRCSFGTPSIGCGACAIGGMF